MLLYSCNKKQRSQNMFKKIKKDFLKSLSVIVASSIMLTSTSAPTQAFSLNELSDFGKNIINRTKKIYDDNTDVCNSAVVVALVAVLLFAIGFNIETTTNVDKEIKKYKDRAPDVFEIEDEVVRETDPEVLLRTLIQLNKLFDKYKSFTKELIKTKKSNSYNKKFTIKLINHPNENIIASTNLNFSGINLSRNYYRKNSDKNLINMKSNSDTCPFDDGKSVERAISHEFGHLIEEFYINEKNSLTLWNYYNAPGFNINFNEIKNCEFEIIKYQIIEKAIEKNKKRNIIEDLGTYSQKDACEFFAEAFATLETSSDSKYKYIRNAVKDVISDWF